MVLTHVVENATDADTGGAICWLNAASSWKHGPHFVNRKKGAKALPFKH